MSDSPAPERTDITYSAGTELHVFGAFGEVVISPRDPHMGPGTLVIVDTGGNETDEPVVVMINDQVVTIEEYQ